MRLCILGTLLLAGTLSASIITLDTGSLTATLVETSTNTFLGFDVRANGVLNAYNPGFIESMIVSDGGSPIPNQTLFVFDSAFTQDVSLTFDGAGSLVGPGFVVVPATGVAGGPLTDPGLQLLVGPLFFGFNITSVFTDPGGAFVADSLSFAQAQSSSVPEPSAIWLVGSVVLLTVALKFKPRVALRRARMNQQRQVLSP